MIDDFERLGDLEDARLAEAIGELSGVTGEQQEWQNEDGARDGQVARAEQLIGGQLDRAHRHDHLINVVVERGQELRPEEGLKAIVAKKRGISAGLRFELSFVVAMHIYSALASAKRAALMVSMIWSDEHR